MAPKASGRTVGSPKYGVMAPTLEELKNIAQTYGMTLSLEELQSFVAEIEGTLESFRRVAKLLEPRPEVRYPRVPLT